MMHPGKLYIVDELAFSREQTLVLDTANALAYPSLHNFPFLFNPLAVIVRAQVFFKVYFFESCPLKDGSIGPAFQVLIFPRDRGIDNHLCLSDKTPVQQLSGARNGIVSVGFDFSYNMNLLGRVTPSGYGPVDLVHIKDIHVFINNGDGLKVNGKSEGRHGDVDLKTFKVVVILFDLDDPMMPMSCSGSQGRIDHKVWLDGLHVPIEFDIVRYPQVIIFLRPCHNGITDRVFSQGERLDLKQRFLLGYTQIF